MSFLATTWALTAIGVLGALLLAVVGVQAQSRDAQLVASFATGVVLLGFIGTLLVAIRVPLSVFPLYGLGLALLAILATRRRRAATGGRFTGRAGPGRDRPPSTAGGDPAGPGRTVQPHRWAARTLVLAAALLVLWILVVSTHDRLWWDGWATWGFKAKVLFLEGGLSGAFLDPAGPYAFTHLDYPIGVPLLGWWIYEHAGRAEPALLSVAGAVWFGLLVLLVWSALRRRVAAWIAALAALGVAAFWPIAYYAVGGTADVVLALALLGMIIELERGLSAGDQAAFWRGGIFLALGALAKNEGVALTIVTIAGLAWAGWRRRLRARKLLPLGVPIGAIAPWVVFRSTNGLSTDTLAWPSVASLAQRAPVLAEAFSIQLTTPEWLPLVGLALVGAVAGVRRGWPGLGLAWTVLGAYFATLCLVYLISPQEIAWLVVTTLPRVLGVLVPAALVLAVLGTFGSAGTAPRMVTHPASPSQAAAADPTIGAGTVPEPRA